MRQKCQDSKFVEEGVKAMVANKREVFRRALFAKCQLIMTLHGHRAYSHGGGQWWAIR